MSDCKVGEKNMQRPLCRTGKEALANGKRKTEGSYQTENPQTKIRAVKQQLQEA